MIRFCFLACLALFFPVAWAQGTVPTFESTIHGETYTFVGSSPTTNATTTIPTVLISVSLVFAPQNGSGKPAIFSANPDVNSVLNSPVFANANFGVGGDTQYVDGLLRSSFSHANAWHTILAKPFVEPMTIMVPAEDGYVLRSRQSGRSLAVADINYVQRQIFSHLTHQKGKLILAITHNTTFYDWGDATICCSWGTHGVDSATGNSFVLASYLTNTPSIVQEQDIQPLTAQLAEFVYNPHHNPLFEGGFDVAPGNHFPRWAAPGSRFCGGSGPGSNYFSLEPTATNLKNDLPTSPSFAVPASGSTYHVQNVALLHWYTQDAAASNAAYSYPDPKTLTAPAKPCPSFAEFWKHRQAHHPTVAALPAAPGNHTHKLIGYSGAAGLRSISPQWDIVIVSFAAPARGAKEGVLEFRLPHGLTAAQFRSDVAYLKHRGTRVMLSLGGGGQYVTLANAKNIPAFVSGVEQIVSEYGFEGVDIDFESPSLELDPGDRDFRHPTTPSIVNLITALREIHDHFGPNFMLSLVPEGPQVPAGFVTYGGQFGSFLPLIYGLRNILTFVDVQDYNTPPLEGLDGGIYQAHTVDYHAAMTELLLQGFNVAGNPKYHFPGLPANKVAVGFLTGYESPKTVSQAMNYLITGHAPSGTKYKLRSPDGYPNLLGAMFWSITGDRFENYRYSNTIGPQLHSYSAPPLSTAK